MNERELKSAYRSLRRQGSSHDKAALLTHLNAQAAKPSARERWTIWLERVWPTWRTPVLGFATAASLALVVGLSLQRPAAPNDEVPEIVDLEFDGGSAMVFEDQVAHTTLIWLSEVEEEEMDEAAEPLDIEEEPAIIKATEAEKI